MPSFTNAQLGQHTRDFPVWGLQNGDKIQVWPFRKGSWWSSWNYVVTYWVIKLTLTNTLLELIRKLAVLVE